METNKPDKKSGNTGTNSAEDRRVRRTKRLLKNALTELILEKGFEDVRVQDVIDRADVGRTSFYTYFKSKEDLLLQNLDDLEDMFDSPENNNGKEGVPDFSLKMFQHLKENWRLARALMGNKRIPVVRNYVQNIILKYYKKQYALKYGETLSPIEIEGAAVITSGALVSMTLWWLSTAKPASPEKMHEIFSKFNPMA